jgi:hypothetical protein
LLLVILNYIWKRNILYWISRVREVVSKSNHHFVRAHADELRDLPDTSFKYQEIDISYSLFRSCIDRELLVKIDEEDGRGVWQKDGIDEVLDSDG